MEPGPVALPASALPLRQPGQVPIQGRILLISSSQFFLTSGPQTLALLRHIEECIHIFE